MLLIKNIDVYAPRSLGQKDVLVAGGRVVEISDDIPKWSEKLQVIDGNGKKLLPGFIDQHVHITGGGGEGSFRTRVPEIQLSKLTTAGITTVVGLLGTDGTTRSVENLLAKAKALKEEGISVYAMTGSYGYPSVSIIGEVKKDISYIDEIIGCKIAISDHRAPHVTEDELTRLASDVRVGGMMSDKAGILVIHVGDGKKGIDPIFNILENTELPVKTMRPTHINRREGLLLQGFDYAKMGGMIDLTCGIKKEWRPARAIQAAIEREVPQEHITISSDGYGSWSNYDHQGNLVEIGVASVDCLFDEFRYMVKDQGMSIEEGLIYFTSNVAKGLALYPKKGSISIGCDADLLITDNSLSLETVICKGQLAVCEKEVLMRGTYE